MTMASKREGVEWTRMGIPRISVIDLTVQCFVSLRRASEGSSLGAIHPQASSVHSERLKQRDRGDEKIAFKVLTFH